PFEIIKEDSTHPARLLAMCQMEVVVTPFFQMLIIDQTCMAVTDIAPGAMKVNDIVAIRIEGGGSRPSPEPLLDALGQETEVAVNRRDKGVAWRQDQRDPTGGEVATFAGNLFGELLGHLPVDIGEIHPRFLENSTFHQYSRPPATPAGSIPGIFAEPRAVELLQRAHDAVLQRAEPGDDAVAESIAAQD